MNPGNIKIPKKKMYRAVWHWLTAFPALVYMPKQTVVEKPRNRTKTVARRLRKSTEIPAITMSWERKTEVKRPTVERGGCKTLRVSAGMPEDVYPNNRDKLERN